MVALLLPETLGKPLAETVDDCEADERRFATSEEIEII